MSYASIIRMWRYPSEDKRVSYSRNIHMRNRQVDAVDVVLDRSNQIASDITDFFLRKALLRNKNKSGIESIIQTIQEKQDKIRLLPQNQSFVVQGCAGSGKTMVLLHRLRYLLFNNDIDSEEYLVLVPTTNFGTFIKDACAEFRIQANNVIPVQSYYKRLSGEKQIDAAADASELVFSPEYLRRLFCFPREKSTQRRCGWSSRWKIWICPASRRARLMSRSRRMCWSIPV